MNHYLYISSGNSLGLEEYIGYFEFNHDGWCCRYLEVQSNGASLKYDEKCPADAFGQLPEGNLKDFITEMKQMKYGSTVEISKELFDSIWAVTTCSN